MYSEEEIWEMTLGKFTLIWREYMKYHGMIQEITIDDVIPF